MALTPTPAMTPAEKRAQRDAAEQDVLLREVDEAVRQGDFEDFMQNWGRKVLYVVLAVLVAFAGYLFWQGQQEDALEEKSETLVSAIDQIQAGNLKGGYDKLAALAEDGSDGAAVAAKLLRAGLAQEQGNSEEAAKTFAEVAADGDAPVELRDLAKVREIAIRYDAMAKPEVIAALKPIAVPGKPFFASAAELLAHAYLAQGSKAEAGALFAQIAKDKTAPESLRARSRQMAGLLGVDAIDDIDTVINRTQEDLPAGQGAPAPAAAAQ